MIKGIVTCGSCREPRLTIFDCIFGVFADVCGRIPVRRVAANVLEAPMEGLHATIVVGGPAAVLVAADAAFEPVHGEKSTVHSLQSIAQRAKAEK